MDQEPSVPAAGGWFGTFAAATQLLYTGNTVDQNWFGPISVTFTRPILEFGVFAQFNDEFFVDPFSFTVYNGPTALNTFTRGVTSFPSFLGARATGADVITSILIRGPSLSAANNDFAIGPLTASTIPEPATLTLLGAGVVGSSWSRRRRSGRVSRE